MKKLMNIIICIFFICNAAIYLTLFPGSSTPINGQAGFSFAYTYLITASAMTLAALLALIFNITFALTDASTKRQWNSLEMLGMMLNAIVIWTLPFLPRT